MAAIDGEEEEKEEEEWGGGRITVIDSDDQIFRLSVPGTGLIA